jgi:glycosyltransferase involved in cell wall biosynthesis
VRLLATSTSVVAAEQAAHIRIILPAQEPPNAIPLGPFKAEIATLGPSVSLHLCGDSYDEQLRLAAGLRTDVVMPFMQLPTPAFLASGMPWVGYMYDFQHRHLPNFFHANDIASRDRDFAIMLNNARHIVVNARAVRDDAERFMGPYPAKLHPLPFGAWPQMEWLQSVLDVRPKYGIDRPYFMISNQFWMHKDHPTAFRALTRFVKAGGDALLVCTGAKDDERARSYFSRLEQLIAQLGIGERVRILGHIPKLDQIRLIRRALALIQPTLSEGGPGGGSVYDAISVGTPVLVSSIPVNQEIAAGDVSFFNPGDDGALAREMMQVFRAPQPRPSTAALAEAGHQRKRAFGEAVIDIARQALAG